MRESSNVDVIRTHIGAKNYAVYFWTTHYSRVIYIWINQFSDQQEHSTCIDYQFFEPPSQVIHTIQVDFQSEFSTFKNLLVFQCRFVPFTVHNVVRICRPQIDVDEHFWP